MEKIVTEYLSFLKIPISKKYCEKLILSHPDYPSFLSISDSLKKLGINNKVLRIAKADLPRVPFPYLFNSEKDGEDLTIIKDRDDLAALQSINTDNASAVVMQVEPTDVIVDEENNSQRSKEFFVRVLKVVMASVISLLFITISFPSFTWINMLLFITGAVGVVMGYILIRKDLGFTYEKIDSFCKIGKSMNCDRILNSDAAKIFGWEVTFSDTVASYFLFQLLVISFLVPFENAEVSFLWALSVISVFTIPVILYSLYFQLFNVKTWCMLCLVVDGVLIIQAIIFGYIYYIDILSFNDAALQSLALLALLFLVIGSALLLIKKYIEIINKSNVSEIRANRIKHSPHIFTNTLFQRNRIVTTSFQEELFIGNPDAQVKFLMVAMPGCIHCGPELLRATQLVSMYPNNVNLTIRFQFLLLRNMEPSSIIMEFIYLLEYWRREIYGKNNESDATEKLLKDWYAVKDIGKFKKKYPLAGNDIYDYRTMDLAVQHSEWVHNLGITRFPTYFINNHWVPRDYNMEDMMTMMPGLLDFFLPLIDKKIDGFAIEGKAKKFAPIATHRNKGD